MSSTFGARSLFGNVGFSNAVALFSNATGADGGMRDCASPGRVVTSSRMLTAGTSGKCGTVRRRGRDGKGGDCVLVPLSCTTVRALAPSTGALVAGTTSCLTTAGDRCAIPTRIRGPIVDCSASGGMAVDYPARKTAVCCDGSNSTLSSSTSMCARKFSLDAAAALGTVTMGRKVLPSRRISRCVIVTERYKPRMLSPRHLGQKTVTACAGSKVLMG